MTTLILKSSPENLAVRCNLSGHDPQVRRPDFRSWSWEGWKSKVSFNVGLSPTAVTYTRRISIVWLIKHRATYVIIWQLGGLWKTNNKTQEFFSLIFSDFSQPYLFKYTVLAALLLPCFSPRTSSIFP